MTHPKDMDEQRGESRPDEAELMLLDLLYGELEEGGEEQVMEQVRERELGGELDGLKQLRAMLRELPDEEPPAAINAKLMHAAAVHAPGGAAKRDGEKKGILAWLSSLIRPVAMYPGLAAATTLILVVGVAGTLYLSGRDQLARPRVSAPAAEPAPGMAAPAEVPPAMEFEKGALEGKPESAELDLAEQATAVPAAGDSPGDLVDREEQAKKPLPAQRSSRGSASKVSKKRKAGYYEGGELGGVTGGSGGGGAATGASYGSKAPAGNVSPRSTAQAKDSLGIEDEAPAADMDAEDDGGRYQPPAEPAPRQEETRSDKSADAPRREAPVAKQDSARIRSLHDEARSAAASGQCDVVRKVAGMIRKLDERYYKSTYLGDKSLATCLARK